ncbi:CAP domain-containing protein [Deinococcus roseus]|uniref:SCP domain-containing protein n=1 Tax=Deinococcus roseus TaxID=392414 RepID=A0ABQ2CYQ5_9DEIO|nr:CAP domain-containing protein [Deinococcus roseus]GGJ33919.1 hypothetical protein GCM10008938_20190 [Deinococcus roseus]
MKQLVLVALGLLTACGTLGGTPLDFSGVVVLDAPSQQMMLKAVNDARAVPRNCKKEMGGTTAFPAAPAVKLQNKLSLAAQYHAQDMVKMGALNHTGSRGDQTQDRIRAAGYSFDEVGENLAVVTSNTALALQKTIEAAIQAWLDSSAGHCQTLMDAQYTELGVGFAENASSADRYYWVQVFGNPSK